MSDARILLAGLPSSGKSTYIGLLFLAIEAAAGSVRLSGFQGDFEYVNSLADRLSRCDEAVRTDVNLRDGFNAELTTEDGVRFSLQLPDYSGETWKTALEARGWSEPVEENVRESSGICLFVKVGALVNDGTIRDARRHLGSLEDHVLDFRSEDVEEGTAVEAPRRVTTQVALVDLIQVLTNRRRRAQCRVSIVLSAFDLAGEVPPAKWVEMNLPLLNQFLRSNHREIQSRVFGASAQGGRFDQPESKLELLERPTLERAFVRDGDGEAVAIEAPVLWAAGVEVENV
jgi:hypothetical protein